MFNNRLKVYLNEGYRILERENIASLNQYLYSGENYYQALKIDMLNAKNEIIILSPKVKLSLIKKYYNFIQSLLYEGINIIIVTKDNLLKDEQVYLSGLGVKLLYQKTNLNDIIIDNKIIWVPNYGYFEKNYQYIDALKLKDVNVIEEVINKIKN